MEEISVCCCFKARTSPEEETWNGERKQLFLETWIYEVGMKSSRNVWVMIPHDANEGYSQKETSLEWSLIDFSALLDYFSVINAGFNCVSQLISKEWMKKNYVY